MEKLVATIIMEALIIAKKNEVEEQKKNLSDFKAVKKSVDDLAEVFIEENGGGNFDDETLKGLVEKASSEFTESLKKIQN